MTFFRERLLSKLVERRLISKELLAKLITWRHPGVSAHVGDRIAAEDKRRLQDTAASSRSSASSTRRRRAGS
jgi:hypothetical protein